jgi:hypothetical protein
MFGRIIDAFAADAGRLWLVRGLYESDVGKPGS